MSFLKGVRKFVNIKNFKEEYLKELNNDKPIIHNDKKEEVHIEIKKHEQYPAKEYNCYPVYISDEFCDVEILIEGNEIGPKEEYLDLADLILKDIEKHISKAISYLRAYFNNHNTKDYYLDTITFGKFVDVKGFVFSGFTINFTYNYDGNIYKTVNLKVKFKKDGWPIGIECGPVF